MKKSTHKALAFFKRNAIYFILSLCILAIGVAAIAFVTNKDNLKTLGKGVTALVNTVLKR